MSSISIVLRNNGYRKQADGTWHKQITWLDGHGPETTRGETIRRDSNGNLLKSIKGKSYLPANLVTPPGIEPGSQV